MDTLLQCLIVYNIFSFSIRRGSWAESNEFSGSGGDEGCGNLTFPFAKHNPVGSSRNLKLLQYWQILFIFFFFKIELFISSVIDCWIIYKRQTFILSWYVWSSVLSPLAWSLLYELFRSSSRSRLGNSYSICLQTLPTFFRLTVSKIIYSACVTRTPTDILTSHWWHFLTTPRRGKRKHTKPNNKTTKKKNYPI